MQADGSQKEAAARLTQQLLRPRDELFDRFQQLIQPERLVENSLQTGLPSLDDRMTWVVAEPGHQRHWYDAKHIFQLRSRS